METSGAFSSQNKRESRSCSRIVVRDSNGGILGSKIVINKNIHMAFAAEAIACVQAVTLGRDLVLTTVEIEGDALSVVKKGQSGGMDRSEIEA